MTKPLRPRSHSLAPAREQDFARPPFIVAPVLLLLVLLTTSCGMLLRPTSPFDRRLTASSYGTILQQANPDGYDCADTFLVKREDGKIITVIMKYDGRVRVVE